ncbi:PREDICTED: gamma-aminobutyric acid receptor subunit beta-2-like [Acropora digitifera]|uniref:gamma-aminobutyric acid receptor subunit beta-2-like n=1 Tax=Acropora digitifera TaxID=70779 RepID=UPI00077A8FCC|nr:PREDICTED: gamma-aminobutyric acid receptor subunit beta-2-like [Acropora digitifera]XP_015753472.1 PREDICTED: gamma-aminobutyric acid receptor subunit beta-2-like [Acropora digitifera]
MKTSAVILLLFMVSIKKSDEAQEERTKIDYTKSMADAMKLSQKINDALAAHDKKVRPNAGGRPVMVDVEFKIISIGEIKEAQMEYTMDIFFRQWWTDPRLAHNFSTPFNMAGDATKLIWTPDTFFWNVKAAKYHKVTRENMRIKIHGDGKVYFSTRITFTAQCDMNLRLYPMDIQECPLIIESYAHTTADVDYRWRGGKSQGIEIVSKEMAQFDFAGTRTTTKANTNSKGSFASLRAFFTFKRRVSYFITATYMPAVVLVILSWCCFWINRTAVPARVTLSITTILTIIYLYGNTNANMPKVSYSKAIDYFLMTSLAFIFMSLLEFVLVLNTDPRFCTQRRREAREEKMKTLYTVIHIFHVAFCKFQIAAFAMICFFLSVVSLFVYCLLIRSFCCLKNLLTYLTLSFDFAAS